MEKMPYDSVFRTMLNDCSGLIIPLINEAFGEDYTGDSSLLIRIFEYDSQIALYDGEVRNRCLEVTFPHSAVLYLRSTGNTPDSLTIGINTLFRYEDLIKNPDSYKEYEDGIISDYQSHRTA